MRGPSVPRAAWAAAPLASLAAFVIAVVWLDPARAATHRFPRPLEGADRDAVLETLEAARRIEADFFASGGAPALLNDYPATKALKHRVFRDIGFLRDRGLVQVQDLAEAIPVSLAWTAPDRAEALVYEEWNHLLQRAEDRAPASELKGMGGGFRYGLRRSPAGRWEIVSWEPEDVARPPGPPGFRY